MVDYLQVYDINNDTESFNKQLIKKVMHMNTMEAQKLNLIMINILIKNKILN